MWFRCNAQPEGGKIPECWFAYEERVGPNDMGRCNAQLWIDEEDCLQFREEITIPVEVVWMGTDNGPVLARIPEPKYHECKPLPFPREEDLQDGGCFDYGSEVVHGPTVWHEDVD
jgi:hypothetical protein